jgi:uncharacterized protein (DUF2235 family)
METLTFEDVKIHFGGLMNIAKALGYVKPTSRRLTKSRATARIGMWKQTGIPKNARAKLILLMKNI